MGHENLNLLSRKEEKEERSRDKIYQKVVREMIAENKFYLYLSTGMEKKVEDFLIEENVSRDEFDKIVLEIFHKEQGALPGELGDRYMELVYSREEIGKRMGESESFYKVIAEIDKELKEKNIFLDKNKVDELIKEIGKDLDIALAA